MENFKTLQIEKKDKHILIVTLNRPEVRNAINFEMMQDLLKLWQSLSKNPEEIRCVVLTGRDKAFCAGADLKERKNISLDAWRNQHDVLEQAMFAMWDCPLPIIAAVNGAAYGGGLEITLVSDFAYAAKGVMFAQSEVKIGIMPGAFGTQTLPRACGTRRAKELAFTGEAFSAEEACKWGIINKLCEPEKLMEETLLTARKICENAPLAIRQVKKAINYSQELDIRAGFHFELEAYNQLLETKDREEGILAFNEKRKPVFSGE